MNDKEMSILLMESMNNFHNLIKVVENERNKMEKILTERQFFALISIRKHRKIELKNLSKDLHVSTSSLCILLNKLVEHEYVYREEDVKDRRNTFYGITEKGELAVSSEIDKFIFIVSEKLKDIDEKSKLTLFNCLSDINSIFKGIL